MTRRTRGYPILLDVAEKSCVIVGGGSVAERKVTGLLEAGAHIIVISPALTDALSRRAMRGEIAVHRQTYAAGLLTELRPLLVFAATNDPAVNRQVVIEAHKIGALADAVNANGDRDFSTMSAIQRGVITIGVSTDGASPALSKHLRTKLEALIGAEYATLAAWLDQARRRVTAKISEEPDRRDMWRAVLESPILDLLRGGDEPAARAMFDAMLEKALP